MKPRLDPKLQAKKMVNDIYQPMGRLMCHISSDEMWKWAKKRTEEWLILLISEIPIYKDNSNPDLIYWNDVENELLKLK